MSIDIYSHIWTFLRRYSVRLLYICIIWVFNYFRTIKWSDEFACLHMLFWYIGLIKYVLKSTILFIVSSYWSHYGPIFKPDKNFYVVFKIKLVAIDNYPDKLKWLAIKILIYYIWLNIYYTLTCQYLSEILKEILILFKWWFPGHVYWPRW